MSRALIGRTVRRLRLEKGLAQQALAARLGISASYLNLIEHDQRAVTATLLIKLTEALQVDLADLPKPRRHPQPQEPENQRQHAGGGLEARGDPDSDPE